MLVERWRYIGGVAEERSRCTGDERNTKRPIQKHKEGTTDALGKY